MKNSQNRDTRSIDEIIADALKSNQAIVVYTRKEGSIWLMWGEDQFLRSKSITRRQYERLCGNYFVRMPIPVVEKNGNVKGWHEKIEETEL